MRKVMIIQARISSTRLPAKSLLPLSGEPLIYRIVERVKRCNKIDEIVVAIPNAATDDVLERQVKRTGVSIFRGSENDLLDRYYKAAKEHKADIVLRLPADNPVSCPEEIDKIIEFHCQNNWDGFSTNLAEVNNSGYPDGIGVEVFSFENLEKAWLQDSYNFSNREHVHLNFYNYARREKAALFDGSIKSPLCPKDFARPELILDINLLHQYLWFERLYLDLYREDHFFCIKDIIKWVDSQEVKL